MSQVLNAIKAHSLSEPGSIALSSADQAYSYGQLADAVADAVHVLKGVCPATEMLPTVAVMLENSPAWVILDLALMSLGWPSLPIPSFFTPDQRQHALNDSGARIMIHAPQIGSETIRFGSTQLGLSRLQTKPSRLPQGTAKITYTSGSTGKPKGVCLSRYQMEMVAVSLVEAIGSEHAGRHLPLLPLSILLENVAGLYVTLIAGGQYHILSSEALGLDNPFRPDLSRLAAAIKDQEATSLILVPELLRALLMVMKFGGVRFDHLTLVAVGGAKVSPQLLADADAMGLPVYEGYGLSECASVVALNTPKTRKAGTVGRPLAHLSVQIEDGEISVGPRPFLGYAGGTINPGPVRTGDLGTFDAAGFLQVNGRQGATIINSFGRNISPEWVESELLAQPEIRQALVFGEAQAELGAMIVPLVPGMDEATIAHAVERANARLPAYAQIKRWRIREPFDLAVGELTGNGRLCRAVLLDHHRPYIEQTETEPRVSFYQELVTETAKGQMALASTPQIQDGLRGLISLETYIAYLTEAYHHVKHTVPLMQAARAKMDDSHQRFREALDEYIEEETGHEAWILNDIRHCGGDAEAVRLGVPRDATQRMVEHAYNTIANINPMGFFGMVFVLEGTSVRLATQGAASVAKNLGLGPDCFSYLTSHGSLDMEHLGFFQKLMDEVTDPADQRAIIETADAIFHRFADLFLAIPHDRQVAHVA